MERKLFTSLNVKDAQELSDRLSEKGFRRSQNVLYRPCCAGCMACTSARIKVAEFRPSASQRRVMRNAAHITREVYVAWAREAHYDLFSRYVAQRHPDGGMSDMDVFEFAAMIEATPIATRLVEYHHPEHGLVATSLTDLSRDGLSMVYSFFSPELPELSLGRLMILDHVELARKAGLEYVYLGFWVPGSPKMAYKFSYQPLELYIDGAWRQFTSEAEAKAEIGRHAPQPVSEQITQLERESREGGFPL